MKYITKIEAMTKEEFQEAGGKAAHLQGELKQPFAEVKGEQEIITRVKECRASLWTARAAFLRRQQGIEHSRGLIAEHWIGRDISGESQIPGNGARPVATCIAVDVIASESQSTARRDKKRPTLGVEG